MDETMTRSSHENAFVIKNAPRSVKEDQLRQVYRTMRVMKI